MYEYACMHAHICVCTYKYVYLYACIYIHMCMYLHTHIHMPLLYWDAYMTVEHQPLGSKSICIFSLCV